MSNNKKSIEAKSSTEKTQYIIPANFYIGLFLITASTLMLQLVQTRILSVVAWYHLAFFAISMAMFGLTGGAVWVYLRRDRFTFKSLPHDLQYFGAAFAITTVVCLVIQMTLVPITVQSLTWVFVWLEIALSMAIPFFFAGVVVSLALTRSPFSIGIVYGVDLIGAAIGCLGVLLLLDFTDAPSAILWVAVLASIGALFFARSATDNSAKQNAFLASFLLRPKLMVLFLAVFAILNGTTDYGLQPIAVKGKFEGGNTHIFREWNSFSRIAVYDNIYKAPHMWGPSPKLQYNTRPIRQRYLNIDGDAGTTAFRFTGDKREVEFLKYDVTNLAYFIPDQKRAAIIGVGGGRDILSAFVFDIKDITGIEINPIFIQLLTEKPGFVEFTNLNNLEGVKFVVDEGRSWFARTESKFDVIQMSLIDTWAATGAGAFTLSENALYTVQGWKTFLDRLTPEGVFTVSRWYNRTTVNETGRMLSLAVATLFELGVTDPRRHIFLASQQNIATLIISRTPLSSESLNPLTNMANRLEHTVLISPTVTPKSEVLTHIINAIDRDHLDRYTDTLEFDLSPPTDNRPFFFNQLRITNPLHTLRVAKGLVGTGATNGGIRQGNLVATATLIVLFLVALLLVLATLVIPLRHALKDVGRNLVVGGSLYFLLIGFGFMMVEIGLLQRMSVFLGHPIYSLSIILFTLILSMGIGSLVSDRLKLDTQSKFVVWVLLTSGYLMLLPLWMPDILTNFNGTSLWLRAAISVAIITPAGLLLGYGFPTGMNLVSNIDRRPTPWFWGINGAAGVLASIIAIACSISLGINATVTIGAVAYLLLIPVTIAFFWKKQDFIESTEIA
ncbi:MAG: hypothetical protein ACC707_10700 [Thiohalomonadales bacterium]